MSTIYLCFLFKVLAKTCDNLFEKGVEKEFYQPVHKFIMNPKAITMDELYGGINYSKILLHSFFMWRSNNSDVKKMIRVRSTHNFIFFFASGIDDIEQSEFI